MTRDIAPIGIRIPPEIKDELYRRAKLAGRKFNPEVVLTLIAGLQAAKGLSDYPTADLAQEIIRRGEYDRIIIQMHTIEQ